MEENFGWTGMQQLCHFFPCLFNGRPYLSAVAMYRRRIAVKVPHEGQHGLDHAIVHGGGGGIVEVHVLHRMLLGKVRLSLVQGCIYNLLDVLDDFFGKVFRFGFRVRLGVNADDGFGIGFS